MTLRMLVFGIARDIIGAPEIWMDMPEHITVEDLRKSLYLQYPAFEKLRSLAIAVNSEYAQSGQRINHMDEIAIIPPVSGG